MVRIEHGLDFSRENHIDPLASSASSLPTDPRERYQPTASWSSRFLQKHQDNSLSHRPRKRFSKKCYGEWLLRGICGIGEVKMLVVVDCANCPER